MMRVLVVDDDFRVASIHRQYVERIAGCEVVGEAHTGLEALELMESLRPDVVLMDVYLPDISGLEVMRRAAHLPVDYVTITAARDVETLRTSLRYGSLHYLVKPFTFPMLQEKLGQIRSWREDLANTTINGQAEVDRLVGALRAESSQRQLPKGLCDVTMSMIERVVSDAGAEMTAVDVARTSGVSRVTARRYLDFLHRQGRVRVRSQYGAAGRPLHLYSVDEAVPG
jgi:response regulator of citrate/malate metabolism